MQSLSNLKKSQKKSLDNRTTKTKASATKPQVFGISLTRNKNNPNPALFNSVRKNTLLISDKKQNNQKNHYSQKKQNIDRNKGHNLFEELNTKVSVDFINTLYSDLGVQFGQKLRSQLQNKENQISSRNVSIALPSKQQKECLDKIRSLIDLKEEINKSYQFMKNTQNLFTYLANKQEKQFDFSVNLKQTHNVNQIHKEISNFLKYYESKQKELQLIEEQYESFTRKVQQGEQKEQRENVDQDEAYLDSTIQSLRAEIANEKRLCMRYEKEEKFLINKLYFTQKKNNDLRASSINLKIKNTNLKDTIKLSHSIDSSKPRKSPKFQRSFSVKLQRIKKYNIGEAPILQAQKQDSARQLFKSQSTSSLNTARRGSFLPNIKKETFLNRIY